MKLDAKGVHYRELNGRIREAVRTGDREVELTNVEGQRYIGAGLGPGIGITIRGVPGNDLGAFTQPLDAPTHPGRLPRSC